uniref:Dynein light chain n=1 Tax=Acrobeloides nanus TaxID=290746 RepID=A0A914DW32_9BILA
MTDNVLSWLQHALSTKTTYDNTVRERHGICTYIKDRLKSYYSSNGDWNCHMGELGSSYTYGSYYIQFDIDDDIILIYNN